MKDYIFREAVRLAGVLHFAQPLSMLIAPKLLKINEDIGKLSPLGRNIFHVLLKSFTFTIVFTGLLVIIFPQTFYSGDPRGMMLSLFLSIFFLYRLYVQVVLYGPFWPTSSYGKLSHFGLALMFVYMSAVYTVTSAISIGRMLSQRDVIQKLEIVHGGTR